MPRCPRHYCFALSTLALLTHVSFVATSFAADTALPFDQQPLAFTGPSDGQQFVARGHGYAIQVTPARTTLMLRRAAEFGSNALGTQTFPTAYEISAISLRLLHADRSGALVAEQPLKARMNYLTAGRTTSEARSFARLTQANVYDGIDFVQYGHQNRLEFDFVVAPHADPDVIAFVYDGACGVSLAVDGRLTLETDFGPLTVKAPIAYQKVNGLRKPVEVAYDLADNGVIRFALGDYDASRTLVIDPVVAYREFLTGMQDDRAQDIAIDADGNAYICGQTISADFPVTPGALDEHLGPEPIDGQVGTVTAMDAFVAKYDANGNLLYNTFLGGTNEDIAWGIAVDAQGNAYICGQTRSDDFPTTPGAWSTENNRTASAIVGEGFVCKLNPAGNALLYSTYLGDGNAERTDGFGTVTGFDACSDIAIDAQGNAYLTGETASALFVTTDGAFDTYHGTEPEEGQLGAVIGLLDAFACKLDPSGSNLLYSTFLGGNLNDRASGITIDGQGNAYITGWTQSGDFPVTDGAYETAFNESPGVTIADPTGDAFVTILNALGTDLLASTYLGDRDTELDVESSNGTVRGMDFGTAIALDADGNVYVCGASFSPFFPTTAGAYDRVRDSLGEDGQYGDVSSSDAFVSSFDPLLRTLRWSTYLGVDGTDFANDLAIDADGNVHVCGSTTGGLLFPETPNLVGKQGYTNLTISDGFYTVFNPTGSLLIESTRFGGTSSDDCQGLKIDGLGNAYLAGYTFSGEDFVSPGFDPDAEFINVGGQFGTAATLSDAYVLKLSNSVNSTTLGTQPFVEDTFVPACPMAALSLTLFAVGGTVITGRRREK